MGKGVKMASAKEIKRHLNVALEEIGEIKPQFDKKFNGWKFHHKKYPDVEYFGDSPEDVIKNYPRYLREFIKHRLNDNIWSSVEKRTKGRGGKREGAGRPKGTKKPQLAEFLFLWILLIGLNSLKRYHRCGN
jgi:hypothetical protein